MISTISVEEVFKPGGLPTHTYVPRNDFELEDQIQRYIQSPYHILSITGPSKIGKTVLVRTALSKLDSCWISGGQIFDIDTLWDSIIEEYCLPTSVSKSEELKTVSKKEKTFTTSIKPGGIGGEYKNAKTIDSDNTNSITHTQNHQKGKLAIDELIKRECALVIDDFHYISRNIQGKIIRYLKDPIFDGLQVLIISVPHRSFDAIRVNKEMTGRVKQIALPPWKHSELFEIGSKGFGALNTSLKFIDGYQLMLRESIGNPLLMQQFCLALCRLNGITSSISNPKRLKAPESWNDFFASRSKDLESPYFKRLAHGPEDGDSRKYYFSNGRSGTIYEGIMMAISKLGSDQEISIDNLMKAIEEVLHEKKNGRIKIRLFDVLDDLNKISQSELTEEPVIEWDEQYRKLHVIDPFFSFYLRWGPYKTTKILIR